MTRNQIRRSTLAAACVLSFLSGCLFAPATQPPPPGPPPPDTNAALRGRVVEAVQDIPRDDCLAAYGMFTIFAEFVGEGRYGDKIKTTADLLNLWGRMVKVSGWEKEKYTKLTDVVEEALRDKGLDVNKPIADVKTDIADAFRTIGLGCKDAALAKSSEGE